MKRLIFSVSVFAAVLLSFSPLAAQTTISSSGNVTGAVEGVNDVSATLKDTDGRRIVSATASGYRGKTGEVVNDAMAKTGDAQRSVPQYLSYTLILSGEIAPDEGGGEFAGEGGPETYSATRLERGAIYIEAEGYETSNITIPSGETAIFRLKNTTGENVFGDWDVSKDGGASQKKDGVKSITFNRSFWGDIISWFTSDGAVTALMPGVYSITATPENRTEPTAAGNLTVVGVDKITRIAEPNTSFWQDLIDDSSDYLLCVETGKPLKLKAYPSGSSFWPEEQPLWISSGSWLFSNHIMSSKKGADQVGIDTSKDNSNFTVTVTCGNSEKKLSIKTFKYQFRINVKRSSNDEPINVGISDVFNGFISVGHAWWKIGLTNSSVKMQDIGLSNHKNAVYVNVNVGYYPQTSTFPPNFSAQGMLKIKDNGSAEKHREKRLTRQEFVNVLNYTKNIYDNPGTYVLGQQITFHTIKNITQLIIDMTGYGSTVYPGANYVMTNEKNCVTVAKQAAAAAGISIGNTVTNGTFEEAGINYTFVGNTPIALYNAM